jgi:hypothetical protein
LNEEQLRQSVRNAFLNHRELLLTIIDVRTGREIKVELRPSPADGTIGISYALIQPEVTQRIRQLFKRKGFDPSAFPRHEFDPKKQDPLPLYVVWCTLRSELEDVLKNELGLEEKPDLDLVLVGKKRAGKAYGDKPDPSTETELEEQDTTPSMYWFAFFEQSRAVKKVLREVLPLNEQSFVPAKWAHETTYVVVRDFLKEYRPDGIVDLAKVEKALVNFKRPGSLRDLPVKPFNARDTYVYIRSAWRESPAMRNENGRYFFRLKQGIEKHKTDKDLWLIFVWFDMVWLPNGEHDPEKWRGRVDSSEDKPDLAEMLTIPVGQTNRKKIPQKTLPTPVDAPANVEVHSVVKESTLFHAAHEILLQTQIKLCGKVLDD